MNLTFKPIPDGPLTFQIEAKDDVTLFEQIAHIQSLFGDTCCGKCKGIHLEFRVRKAQSQKNGECKYYERICLDCGAKLDFGQNRVGGSLFPKRSDKDNNGWYVWESFAPKKTVMKAPPASVVEDEENEEMVPF